MERVRKIFEYKGFKFETTIELGATIEMVNYIHVGIVSHKITIKSTFYSPFKKIKDVACRDIELTVKDFERCAKQYVEMILEGKEITNGLGFINC